MSLLKCRIKILKIWLKRSKASPGVTYQSRWRMGRTYLSTKCQLQPISERSVVLLTTLLHHCNADHGKHEIDGQIWFTPCYPDDLDAIPMTWREVPQGKMKEPQPTGADFFAVSQNVKPSVGPEELENAMVGPSNINQRSLI